MLPSTFVHEKVVSTKSWWAKAWWWDCINYSSIWMVHHKRYFKRELQSLTYQSIRVIISAFWSNSFLKVIKKIEEYLTIKRRNFIGNKLWIPFYLIEGASGWQKPSPNISIYLKTSISLFICVLLLVSHFPSLFTSISFTARGVRVQFTNPILSLMKRV